MTVTATATSLNFFLVTLKFLTLRCIRLIFFFTPVRRRLHHTHSLRINSSESSSPSNSESENTSSSPESARILSWTSDSARDYAVYSRKVQKVSSGFQKRKKALSIRWIWLCHMRLTNCLTLYKSFWGLQKLKLYQFRWVRRLRRYDTDTVKKLRNRGSKMACFCQFCPMTS